MFIKHGKAGKPPYTLIIIAFCQDDCLSVINAFKAYPTLVPNIEDKSPIELLEHLANQFGLDFKIAGSQNKRFYLRDKIPLNNISLSRDISIDVDNPNNHKWIQVAAVKVETGPQTIVNCALGFCINMDLYSRWIRSKGEFSYFNEEISRLQRFTAEKILPNVSGKGFREKVFTAIHDFCFYCRQHPASLSDLHEEQIRDLFLIVIKTIFSSAEGEPFHYNGKLDFKVTNPENKYEIITGEFKWWRGNESAEEVFHQSIRKHATGQELEIYAVILNKNKDAGLVFETVKEIISKQPEVNSKSFKTTTPIGSKEMFGNFTVKIRGNEIPFQLGLGDLFFERV